MSEQTKIIVKSPFRCNGAVVKPNKQLTVGKDVTKSEARALVYQKKALWADTKSNTKSGTDDE